jgi:hypothetical protein
MLAALKLWQTSVPDDLSLPNLDPSRYFSEALLDRAASYQAFLRVDEHLLRAVEQRSGGNGSTTSRARATSRGRSTTSSAPAASSCSSRSPCWS